MNVIELRNGTYRWMNRKCLYSLDNSHQLFDSVDHMSKLNWVVDNSNLGLDNIGYAQDDQHTFHDRAFLQPIAHVDFLFPLGSVTPIVHVTAGESCRDLNG